MHSKVGHAPCIWLQHDSPYYNAHFHNHHYHLPLYNLDYSRHYFKKKKLIEMQVLWIDDVLDLHNALWLKGSNCSCRLLLLVAQEVPQPSNLTTCLRIICVHYVLGLLSMLGPNIVQSVQKMFRTS